MNILIRGLLTAIVLCFVFIGSIQGQTIKGQVSDNTDKSYIAGATIKIEGETVGTISDSRGRFSISARPGDVLDVSFIGYLTQKLTVSSNLTFLEFHLIPSKTILNDVVVVGYGTKRKSSLTGSIAVVNSKEFDHIPAPSFENILQGKAPGVQITGQNGAPGANAFIRIRGINSITASTEPIIVVDGLVIDQDAYNLINPNDIDNVSILKDPASAAVYGSRGGNGVILITTKRGTSGRPRISYNMQYGFDERIPDNFGLTNADQKLQYEKDLGYVNGYLQNSVLARNSSGSIDSLQPGVVLGLWDSLKSTNGTTDWRKQIFRRGTFLKNQVSVSGADDKFNYFFSLEKLSQNGITRGSDFQRTGGRLNVEYKATDYFTIGSHLNIGHSESKQLRDVYNDQNPFFAAYVYNPYEPVYNKDGTFFVLQSTGFNVLEAIKNNPEVQRRTSTVGDMYAIVRPIKDLELKTSLAINNIDYQREYFIKPGSILDTYVGDPSAPGIKTDNGNSRFNFDWTNVGIYSKKLDVNNTLKIIGGSEFVKEKFSTYRLSSKGYANPDLSTQDNSSSATFASTTRSDFDYFHVFLNPYYNYQNKYFVDASISRDGSSRFGSKRRFGTFYSAGVAWDISKEGFLKENKFVNSLKLRGNIGTTGNYSIGNYASLGTYKYESYNGSSAARPFQVSNPNLTWEKSLSSGLGLDFSVLQSRVSGSIDYYYRKSTSLLLNKTLSPTTGILDPITFSPVTLSNVGSLSNKGVEVALNYDAVRDQAFTLSFGGNLSFNRNKVLSLTNPHDSIFSGIESGGYTVVTAGLPFETYYLTRYVGVDPSNGAPRYLDKSGSIQNTFKSSYAVPLKGKSPLPKFYGGFNTTLGYKGVSLNGSLYFSGGNYIYNNNYQYLNSDGGNIVGNQSTDALNFWKKPGDVNVSPKPANSSEANANLNVSSTRFLQNGSFIRLRDLTLAYEFPKEWIKYAKLQTVRIYLQGHNLAVYRPHFKGDPEVGIGSGENGNTGLTDNGIYTLFSYPQTRSYTFGVDLSF